MQTRRQALTQSARVAAIEGPDLAENGDAVALTVRTALPGVKQLLLLVEKNPTTLIAVFNVTDRVEANLATRVKLAQSTKVYTVALMADGQVRFSSWS